MTASSHCNKRLIALQPAQRSATSHSNKPHRNKRLMHHTATAPHRTATGASTPCNRRRAALQLRPADRRSAIGASHRAVSAVPRCRSAGQWAHNPSRRGTAARRDRGFFFRRASPAGRNHGGAADRGRRARRPRLVQRHKIRGGPPEDAKPGRPWPQFPVRRRGTAPATPSPPLPYTHRR